MEQDSSLFLVIIQFLLCLLEVFLILELRSLLRNAVQRQIIDCFSVAPVCSHMRYWFGSAWIFGNSEVVAPTRTVQIPF